MEERCNLHGMPVPIGCAAAETEFAHADSGRGTPVLLSVRRCRTDRSLPASTDNKPAIAASLGRIHFPWLFTGVSGTVSAHLIESVSHPTPTNPAAQCHNAQANRGDLPAVQQSQAHQQTLRKIDILNGTGTQQARMA